MKFSKPMITGTLGEPMVYLDATALTQRIGTISHPEKPAPSSTPIYHTATTHQQPFEAKWRRALRPRGT